MIYDYICAMIQRKVRQFIEQEKLFDFNSKLLVALSGGADSVALLHILLDLGYNCQAAHCNFHLRGDESQRDQSFVEELCRKLNVKLHLVHFDTKAFAESQKISIEMAARKLRYEWFESVCQEQHIDFIAVGHHKDDQAETILLNLVRGTGITGLTGIRTINGRIVRPFLCITRSEIVSYLNGKTIGFVTDSTNLEDEYTRNKIRLNIIPQLESLNPSFKESIVNTAEYLNNALLVYRKGITEGTKRVLCDNKISIPCLLNEPSPEALLYEILYPLGFNPAQVKEIHASLSKQSGKQFVGRDDWKITKNRDELLIEKKRNDDQPPFTIETFTTDYNTDFVIPKDKSVACFDAEKIRGELTLRKWQRGDAFVPFGMTGRKLISDYMTDRKFSLSQKEQQWLLCCGDKIVWVVGERSDNRFRIDAHTKQVITCRLKKTD